MAARSARACTLAESFAAVLDLVGPGRREVLEAALATEALSGEWRGVEGKLHRLDG